MDPRQVASKLITTHASKASKARQARLPRIDVSAGALVTEVTRDINKATEDQGEAPDSPGEPSLLPGDPLKNQNA